MPKGLGITRTKMVDVHHAFFPSEYKQKAFKIIPSVGAEHKKMSKSVWAIFQNPFAILLHPSYFRAWERSLHRFQTFVSSLLSL